MEQVNFYDFSKMHIDLSKVGEDQSVFDVYPQLRAYKHYTDASENEIKIGFFMCDRHGPFSAIKRFEIRLDNIFRFMQLDADGADSELYQGVLKLTNEKILNIWTQYLADCFDHAWVNWYSNSVLYYQMMEALRKPINMTDDKAWTKRTKIETRADVIYSRMEKLEEKVFVDDVIKRKAFEQTQNLIQNYPEKFAMDASVI